VACVCVCVCACVHDAHLATGHIVLRGHDRTHRMWRGRGWRAASLSIPRGPGGGGENAWPECGNQKIAGRNSYPRYELSLSFSVVTVIVVATDTGHRRRSFPGLPGSRKPDPGVPARRPVGRRSAVNSNGPANSCKFLLVDLPTRDGASITAAPSARSSHSPCRSCPPGMRTSSGQR